MRSVFSSRPFRHWVFASAALIIGIEGAFAQASKAIDKLEIEKKLLTYPDNPLDPAWQAAWVKYVGISISPRVRNDFGPNDYYAIVVTNRTPCTIKLSGEYITGLAKDGNVRAKESAPWTILPGKNLYVGVRPKLATFPINNDLARKPIVVLSVSTKPMCQLEILPEKSDLKPLTLNVLVKYGKDQFDRFIAGERVVFRPEDEQMVIKKLDLGK